MKATDFFEETQDLEQLYITYTQHSKNYQLIKDKLAGDAAKKAWKSSQRGRKVFIIGVGLVALAGSAFAYWMGNPASIFALFLIWAVSSLIFGVYSGISYKNSYKVLLENTAFFEKFESIAKAAPTLEDFKNQWK